MGTGTAFLETILFIWLTPGMVFNAPSLGASRFFSETTSWQAILVHAALFAVALCALKYVRLVEGFQEEAQMQSAPVNRAAGSNRRRIEQRLAEKQFFGAV